MGDLANALLLSPVHREPTYKPQKEVFYGGNGTIHDTGHLDVVLDEDGNVTAVWFRCRPLPFKQSERRETVDNANMVRRTQDYGKIKGIVFEDE